MMTLKINFLLLGCALLLITVTTVMQPIRADAKQLARPSNLSIEDTQTSTPKLKWSKVKNATQYIVQVRTSKGKLVKKWKLLTKPSKRFQRNILPTGKTVKFRVKACSSKKITKRTCSIWSKNKRIPPWSNNPPDEDEEEIPFIIKSLVVDIEDWNTETNTAGAFVFTSELTKVFLEFGATVVGPDGPKILPTFEYIVDDEAPVYSPIDGVINAVEYQEESADYEIHINPTAEVEQMTVVLDHVLNVQVSEGQSVMAGDVVGTPGTHSSEGLGRVEIEIFGDGYMHCPFEFFDETTRQAYENKIWELMSDWETFTGNNDLYDEETMQEYAAGCLAWQYE